MSLLCFWDLIVIVSLLSIEGQRALRSHQTYLNLCSEDERRSYRFGSTWGWVINDRIFIFGWTNPLITANSTQTVQKRLGLLPTHVCPSPANWNPSRHSQRKDPGWLLQMLYGPQIRGLSEHSSTSEKPEERDLNINTDKSSI